MRRISEILNRSLRARLVLAIALLGILFCAVLTTIQIETTRRAVREEVGAANRVTEQLLARVGQTAGGDGVLAVQRFLEGTGRIRANDISVFDLRGELLYRSPPSQYKQGRRAPQWFASLVAPRVEPRTVRLAGGKVDIAAEPSRAILDGWEDTRWLVGFAAGFVLLSALVVALAAGRAADRTEHLLEDSRAVHDWLQQRIEAERKLLAQDLHDEVAQSVTAIKSIARALPDLPPAQAREAADAIATGAAQLYDGMQAIVSRLRPLAIDTLGLEASLNDLVAQLRRQPGAPAISFAATGADRVPEALRLPTFRIAQEALTNAIRHADARQVSVRLEAGADRVELRVSDDGRGIDPALQTGTERGTESGAAWGGFGLRGMRERALAAGGTLRVGPCIDALMTARDAAQAGQPDAARGKGTTIHASLPIGAAAGSKPL